MGYSQNGEKGPQQVITLGNGRTTTATIYPPVTSPANQTATTGGGATADGTIASLDDQAAQLRSLLGRTNTGLNQGLGKLSDDYQSNVNQQQSRENQALSDYGDQRVSTNQDKQKAYDTINQNAHTGYSSLAQIIGRASGTGSSAFQELLPNVVGKDTSSKRTDTNQTYGKNIQGIDKAQKSTELSFENILADLAKQRQQGEQDLRTGIEGQRQTLQQQLEQNAGQRAQALGGGYQAVHDAQAPYQAAIENSRNSVENFFNQFRSPITSQQAAIATPDLSHYTTDRSVVNANQQGAPDPTNPYSDILRRKLQQEQGV